MYLIRVIRCQMIVLHCKYIFFQEQHKLKFISQHWLQGDVAVYVHTMYFELNLVHTTIKI